MYQENDCINLMKKIVMFILIPLILFGTPTFWLLEKYDCRGVKGWKSCILSMLFIWPFILALGCVAGALSVAILIVPAYLI